MSGWVKQRVGYRFPLRLDILFNWLFPLRHGILFILLFSLRLGIFVILLFSPRLGILFSWLFPLDSSLPRLCILFNRLLPLRLAFLFTWLFPLRLDRLGIEDWLERTQPWHQSHLRSEATSSFTSTVCQFVCPSIYVYMSDMTVSSLLGALGFCSW